MSPPDSDREKQDVLSYRPDITFERKRITGEGDSLSEDPSDRAAIRDRLSERDVRTRTRRLANIKRIEDRLDALEERILSNLQDFRITFDPVARPGVAQAVDQLMREDGPTPTAFAPEKEAAKQAILETVDTSIVRTLEEQDTSPPGEITPTPLPPAVKEVNLTCYRRAVTLSMDSMFHIFGIDPIIFGLANDGKGPPMVPPPNGAPKNCREMEEMRQANTDPDAELMPADAVLEKKQRSTLFDLFRIVWKLLLYFIYGWIIEVLTKLKMHKIPFGVGKKVKKFIKKLKEARKKILCLITGDCPEEEEGEDPYVPDPYDGFETTDLIGDEAWSGIECLAAARTVLDFVSTQLAFHPAVDIQTPASKGAAPSGGDVGNLEGAGVGGGDSSSPSRDARFGKIEGKAHLLPVMNALMQARDRFESVKFATIMDIPSTETQFEKDIQEIEEKSKSRPRYNNRFNSRTAQGWKNLR